MALSKPPWSTLTVSSSISFALTMVNSKVVSRKLLSTADMSRAQSLRIHESTKVVVVSQHDNFKLGALKVVPLILLEAPLSTVHCETLPESKGTLASELRKLGSAVFLAFIEYGARSICSSYVSI